MTTKCARFKIGDRVTFDAGWNRVRLVTFTVTTVQENCGGKGQHRYWGSGAQGEWGAYEDQLTLAAPRVKQ